MNSFRRLNHKERSDQTFAKKSKKKKFNTWTKVNQTTEKELAEYKDVNKTQGPSRESNQGHIGKSWALYTLYKTLWEFLNNYLGNL